MTGTHGWRLAILALLLAGCAETPVSSSIEDETPIEPDFTPAPVEHPPLIESPPLEPVEPPLPAPSAAPSTPAPQTIPQSPPSPPVAPPPTIAPPSVTPPAATPAAPPPAAPSPAPPQVVEPPEDAQMNALLGDLSRYATLSSDDIRREIANATQALNRQRTDANRVRLAVLYTLARGNAQDDQRALQLFDNVARSGGPPSSVKALAIVLQAQIAERQRAIREEQAKGEQAVRKLDQLLEMERTLLRDRVRSGGGGGGGGGGGSAGGH